MAKRGRPSKYTEKLAEEICARIARGESLVRICKDDHVPSMNAVFRWLGDEEREDFRQRYARAREQQADAIADECMEIAEEETDVNRAKLKIDTRKWFASKLKPKVYGERMSLEHSGEIELTNEQLESRLSQLFRKAGIDGPAGRAGKAKGAK